jgi:hypothetical protein
LKLSTDNEFNWARFHAYRVFDEFVENFVILKKSYVTCHPQRLNLETAFEDICTRFVAAFDDSTASFEDKVALQFEGASEESKIVFANVEFLWAMPMENILPSTKRAYAQRWFTDKDQVVIGERYFFGYPHIIANPGPWYLRNKYWELVALFQVLSLVANDNTIVDLASAKKRIADLSYPAIYEGAAKEGRFAVTNVCGVHSALLHLSAPNIFESIISESHKQQIVKVFEHVVADRPQIVCREQKIRLIRERLYEDYGDEGDSDQKYRWFFYLDRLRPLWIGKSGATQRSIASIDDEVQREQAALDYTEEEGGKETTTAYRVYRSAKLAMNAKKRDNFTCQACDFNFRKQIVHVHHLDPLSERQSPKKTSIEDLVTLCPNCHYLAHFWLRKSNLFKKREALLQKLRST